MPDFMEAALVALGYYYQPETGAYVTDNAGILQSYVKVNDNEWDYECYDDNAGKVIATGIITVN